MRKKIIAGNWKMNLNAQDVKLLVEQILSKMPVLDAQHQVIFAPSYLYLTEVAALCQGKDFIHVAAQNCHHENGGAYTGEVSPVMLKSAGITHVILGHSERRAYNHEDAKLLSQKTNAALAQGLQVIFCCGEPLEIRDAGTQNNYVGQQIMDSLFHLSESELQNICIAYEPIWAIGTGRTASAAQAQEMHAHIRQLIAGKYGATIADQMTLLYGGSCKGSNAAELFEGADVDGGLIGGAALVADDFLQIIAAMNASK